MKKTAEFDDRFVKLTIDTSSSPHHAYSYADVAGDRIIAWKMMSGDNPFKTFIEL